MHPKMKRPQHHSKSGIGITNMGTITTNYTKYKGIR